MSNSKWLRMPCVAKREPTKLSGRRSLPNGSMSAARRKAARLLRTSQSTAAANDTLVAGLTVQAVLSDELSDGIRHEVVDRLSGGDATADF